MCKSELNLTLQRAQLKDIEYLLPLVQAYHQLEQLNTVESDRRSAVLKLLESPQYGGIWLIFLDKKLTGYIALCRGFSIEFNGFDAFIDELFIKRMYRGKGIGSEVLKRIKQQAKNMQVNALHLEVARTNSAAQKCYKNAGFKPREKYLLMSADLP